MKILITQRELRHFGGTEMFTIDVARALSRRGHSVAIYCPSFDEEFSRLISVAAVPTRSSLAELPWVPDVIHGQHHLPTMAALARFGTTRAIYFWHGVRPWVERPPQHRRIARYGVTCERMLPVLEADFGIAADRVVTVNNFVDLQRFTQVRKAAVPPTRAVLFHGDGFSHQELAQLASACAANGLTLDRIGPAYGNPQANPEGFLPTYDLAFASGRSAIEALASGCAVIPIHPGRAGEIVTDETFDEWVYTNFATRPYSAASAERLTADWLRAQLSKYSPQMLGRTTARVRETLNLDAAVGKLEGLYESALSSELEPSGEGEFSAYLERLTTEVDGLWIRAMRVDGLGATEAARYYALEAQITALSSQVSAAIGKRGASPLRRLLSRLRRLLVETGERRGKGHP